MSDKLSEPLICRFCGLTAIWRSDRGRFIRKNNKYVDVCRECFKTHPDALKPKKKVYVAKNKNVEKIEKMCLDIWGLSSDEVNGHRVAFIYEDEIRSRIETGKKVKVVPKHQLQSLRDIGVFLPSKGTRTFVDVDRFNQVLQHPCIVGCRDPDAPPTLDKASYPELIEATI